MSGWVRLAIALSGLWSLLLLGSFHASSKGQGVGTYLLFLLVTLGPFWGMYFGVRLIFGSKEKGDRK